MLYILGGVFKMPLVVVHGVTKMFYWVPILYGDKTVREWPVVTGFFPGCVVGAQVSDCAPPRAACLFF